MSNNYILKCFIHTLILLFSLVTFFFSFFLNKEITGDKLEEENKIREEERKKKKDLSISRKIHFKTNIYIKRDYCLKYFQMDVVKSIRGMTTDDESVFVKMMDS